MRRETPEHSNFQPYTLLQRHVERRRQSSKAWVERSDANGRRRLIWEFADGERVQVFRA